MSGAATLSVGQLNDQQLDDPVVKPVKRVRIELEVPRFVRLMTTFTYVFIAVLLGYILWVRGEGHLTAESGLGYSLGIAGVVATVALLTYPLRKRLKFMRNWGATATWFHFHMLLGILAPALILAHSGFRIGSLNSSIALFSMLVVAASGVIGRYIYVRIHFGLYGARATVEELRAAVGDEEGRIGTMLSFSPSLRKRLVEFAARALAPQTNVFLAAGRVLLIGVWIQWVRFAAFLVLSRDMRREAKRSGWSPKARRQITKNTRMFIAGYLGSIRKTVQFTLYERFFSLWHVLHIPLFFMLLIATSVHIVAVHLY
jgi:hypothetical protein